MKQKLSLIPSFQILPPGKSTIKDWYAKFRRGEMSTEDGERSRRPKEVVTDENIKKNP